MNEFYGKDFLDCLSDGIIFRPCAGRSNSGADVVWLLKVKNCHAELS
jgi:hypothetical protein